jgi:hypothetical protein
MSRAFRFFVGAFAITVAASLPGCSDDPAVSASSVKLSEEYRRLGDNLGTTMALIKSSATAPGPITPADLASVGRVPKNLTGGVDIGVEQSGKSGEKAANIDGIGADETVTTFVPDAPTGGTGTAATLPSFVAWKGDADSDDPGLCYLAWTKGASWFVASKCGDATGAWVCQVTSADTVCNACNAAGACAECDMTQPNFTCSFPP